MLSNAYSLATFRFDTAKNEPAKNLQNFANFEIFPIFPILLTLTPVQVLLVEPDAPLRLRALPGLPAGARRVQRVRHREWTVRAASGGGGGSVQIEFKIKSKIQSKIE